MSGLLDTRTTEWKVKIASLASFAGSLAASVLIDEWAPGIVERLPSGAQAVGAAALAAAAAWFAGRAAKSRPDAISQSTLEAVRVRAAMLHRNE